MNTFSIQGKIVDVREKKIKNGRITVLDGKIQSIEENTLKSDHYILPGFVDAHVHVESSMLIPSEFARLAVLHGTVGTISDPHEIGNVLGVEGVRYMVENGAQTPFKFHFGAPSCVPATSFETAGATIGVSDLEVLFSLPNVTYLAEMMNFPGVIHRDPEVMAKIELAKRLGKAVDGHAPGLRGEDLQKYISAGITTDHECFTLDEALEKLSLGMKVIIREGSAAKNFEALWTLIDRFPGMIMLCSDDKHPNDLVRGHINQLCARAIAKGCNLFAVLEAACIQPVEHYSMNVGTVKINDPADFIVVKDLDHFEVLQTYLDGVLVAENGKSFIPKVTAKVVNQFNPGPILINDFVVPAISTKQHQEEWVIGVADGQLVTEKMRIALPVINQEVQSDSSQDVLKIAVVNRYKAAKPAVGFIHNIGLKKGAIASCVAHDSHNIIVVGTNDQDMLRAVELIIEQQGGVSLANGEEEMVVGLPVAGIMSNGDAYEIAAAYEAIDHRAKALGSHLSAPFMTLSFCALLVIPKLKISDLGMFDGEQFTFV